MRRNFTVMAAFRPALFATAALALILGPQALAAEAGTSIVDANGSVIGTYSGTTVVGSYNTNATTFDTVSVLASGQWIRVLVGPTGFSNFGGGFQPLYTSNNCTGQAYLYAGRIAPVCTSSPTISNNKSAFLSKITLYCPGKTAQNITVNSYYNSEDARGVKACTRYYGTTELAAPLTTVTLSNKPPFSLK